MCALPGSGHLLCAQLRSRVWLFCDPMDCSLPCSSVHGIFQARIHGLPYPPPDRPNSGIEPESPVSSASQVDSLPSEPLEKPYLYCFWLHWVSVAAHGLSLAVSRGLLSCGPRASLCSGFSLWSRGSRALVFQLSSFGAWA